MTISIWRYSHLTLAISSALFIIIAALTGIILAIEPISNKLKTYDVVAVNEISVAETLQVLQKNYDEIITVEIDENNFVTANVILENGNSDTFYINPKTGEKIGEIEEKKPIFEFATNLHRSLFLKSTGRFIIGFVSFLLLLISITGIILIAKRQGGFLRFFTKIVKEDFNQYYHIIIGRFMLIPIVIITITGVYLSLEKFSLLPKDTSSHQINDEEKEIVEKNIADFEFFKATKLSEIQKIEFPFSIDEEDYFFVKYADKEIAVQQFTGQIISKKNNSLATLGSYYSLIFHTGKGSYLWSIVLLLACFAILFFVFSGFSMTLKRNENYIKINNKYTKDEAEFIILFGSETGSTINFATLFYKALLKANKTVFLADLNSYTSYKKAKSIVVFTATYGKGEAPANAHKFLQKFKKIKQNNVLQFSVIGFGSKAYPDYCKYAILVQASLQLHQEFLPVLPIFKIHNQSFSEFITWANEWSSFYKLNLNLTEENLSKSDKSKQKFLVVNKTKINADDTFLIELKPSKKVNFKSGDLLAFAPKKESRKRLYSIAKINDSILLSVKKHEFGVCSTFLNDAKKGGKIEANIQKNTRFHFPENAKEVVLIANGTGIAPFLGMINDCNSKMKIHLFWGGRTKKSLEIYQDYIDTAINNNPFLTFYVTFSQEQEEKIYVQDLLLYHSKVIANVLKNGDSILLCGSLNMQKGVFKELEKIAENGLNTPFIKFLDTNQIKTDCY